MTIEYGGGTDEWRSHLTGTSESVAAYEEFEKVVAELPEHHEHDHEVQGLQRELENSTRRIEKLLGERLRLWNVNADLLNDMISWLDARRLKGQKQ